MIAMVHSPKIHGAKNPRLAIANESLSRGCKGDEVAAVLVQAEEISNDKVSIG